MYTDLFGKKRIKLGLHHHTTLSDGDLTPEQTAERYRNAGYDAIALTDHWCYQNRGEINGFPILSGVEYDISTQQYMTEVWHVLGLFAERAPQLEKGATPQDMIDAIHAAGGLAVLAHPAWSLNKPSEIEKFHGFDATEIFNTVSSVGPNRRGDSSLIVDMLGYDGFLPPLLAADDSHRYGNKGIVDSPVSFIMAECDSVDPEKIKKAILEKNFYASQGPEIHLIREADGFRVKCSPVSHIHFFTNVVYDERCSAEGENLTEAFFPLYKKSITFVRAEVIDKDGKRAWSNSFPV